MKLPVIVPAILVTVCPLVAFAQEPSSRPDTRPAASAPASQPGSRPAPLDPVVERILDRLESRGKSIKDIESSISFYKYDKPLDGKQLFEGTLLFFAEEPNPAFTIQFDKATRDGEVSKEKEWHAFGGEFYVEAREATKTRIPHRIVEPGKKVEVFRLGEGPFPLPFGQKKADIVKHFTVRLIPSSSDDPKNTDHLECTPIPGTELARKYGIVYFWIDRTLDLPVKVTTLQMEDETEITVSFSNVRINTGMARSRLELPPETKDYKEPEGGGEK